MTAVACALALFSRETTIIFTLVMFAAPLLLEGTTNVALWSRS